MELRETSSVLAPIEFSRVDDDAPNGGSMAADPFGGRVDNDISTMVDGTDEVTSSTKGVVDLNCIRPSPVTPTFWFSNLR